MRVPQHRPLMPQAEQPAWPLVEGVQARTSHPKRSLPVALLDAARPRQWVKNLLVFAAPTAAGVIFHLAVFGRCLAAFGIFVAASASTYLVNDILDKDADRLHPVKRYRPVATGELPVRVAWTAAAVLLASSLMCASLLAGVVLAAVVGTYAAITLAYSLGLKRVPVIELACVGSGFVLRAMAGGAATHVPLSPWFLLVTSFGALFIVGGKRSSEHEVLGEHRAGHRAALGEYPAGFLRTVRMLCASVAVTTYCLWAFDRYSQLSSRARSGHLVWFELSIVPFVLAMLAVEYAVERGLGGAPEELALKDRTLQVLGLAWVALLLVGIYL
jgi:decaprenyl-phosphate phosphoribosyltransferase